MLPTKEVVKIIKKQQEMLHILTIAFRKTINASIRNLK